MPLEAPIKESQVRLTDIARKLHLSVGTVSKALKDDGRVKLQTRSRVQKAARRMGYVPDMYAQALRTQKSRHIGLLLPSLENPLFVEKVAHAQEAAADRGYRLSFACSECNAQREYDCCMQFLGMRIEGVIIAGRAARTSNETYSELFTRGVAVVDLGQQINAPPGASTLGVDTIDGAYQAACHLLEMGHRRFGLIGYNLSRNPRATHRFRYQGIVNALRQAGLTEEAITLLPSQDDTIQAGYDCIHHWLQSGMDLPSALIALNDEVARGALAALADHHIHVPGEVSLVGYDNTLSSRFTRPALTTVSQTHLNIGRQAVEMLLHIIDYPKEPPRHVKLKPELVIRQSSGKA